MRKLILTNFQAPGDLVMLTAAVRDLHACHPEKFLTDVRTSCPELWENNPYLTPLELTDPEVEVIPCEYPLVHLSNERPVHFLRGFTEHLGERLGVRIEPTRFHGDIHLSPEETAARSPVAALTGVDVPYWLIGAGGKFDFTIKWWHFRRWQEVVNALQGRVLFVQTGKADHYHPRLNGVLDLRGKTSLRELILLVRHAHGIVCPITALMHLAAAVPPPDGRRGLRPCVVVAGGRESPAWEAYPGHQFLHTIGALPCCSNGGCWRSRAVPLGDGDEKDQPEHLCINTVGALPACMNLITAEKVCDAIQLYFDGGRCEPLVPQLQEHLQRHLTRDPWGDLFQNFCPDGETPPVAVDGIDGPIPDSAAHVVAALRAGPLPRTAAAASEDAVPRSSRHPIQSNR